MEKNGNADLKNNTKSIRELMKRLSLSPSNFHYSKAVSNATESSDQNGPLKNSDSVQFSSSMENAQILSLLSAATSSSSSQLLPTPDANLSNTSVANSNSSVANKSNGNESMVGSTKPAFQNDDYNNPFDVTENKDQFKSHDTEIKQLIINVKLQE